MSVAFYMDVHVPRAVTTALRLRGIDVLTAQHDGASTLSDDKLLLRATELGRVMVSQDTDMLREGSHLKRAGVHFTGLVYAHQPNVSIGQLIADLWLIAEASEPTEWIGRIEYFPLT